MRIEETPQSPALDRPATVRPGEELDSAAVAAHLRSVVPGLDGELQVAQFRGGASNLTYQLSFGDKQYILRTAPVGTKAKSAHDMRREFGIQQQLKPHYPYVPQMIAFCDDPGIIGRDFYVMEKLSGLIPRANLPKGLDLTEPETRQLCTIVLDKLIELHRLDISATGLDSFGKGTGYCARQIAGWTDRYGKAKTWNVPSFKKVATWLQANIPTEERSCFIHNDFRLDNVVLSPTHPHHIVGVLDWEMATIGDPLMDLGNSLAYWVQADDDFFWRTTRRQPTHLPGMLTRRQVVDYYCQQMGLPAVDFRFYEVYGLFRLAGIIQQIYYRYHHGQTRNPAYRRFWLLVGYLNWRCQRVIARRA